MLLYAVMRSSDGTADVALMAFVTCDLIDYISYETGYLWRSHIPVDYSWLGYCS